MIEFRTETADQMTRNIILIEDVSSLQLPHGAANGPLGCKGRLAGYFVECHISTERL